MEAAEHIPDSFIDLMVQKKENTPFVVIVLVNSCRSMPILTKTDFPFRINPAKEDMALESKVFEK